MKIVAVIMALVVTGALAYGLTFVNWDASCPKGQHFGIVSSYWVPSYYTPGHEFAYKAGKVIEDEWIPGYWTAGHIAYIWGCES